MRTHLHIEGVAEGEEARATEDFPSSGHSLEIRVVAEKGRLPACYANHGRGLVEIYLAESLAFRARGPSATIAVPNG